MTLQPICLICQQPLARVPAKPDYCLECRNGHRWELRDADEVWPVATFPDEAE